MQKAKLSIDQSLPFHQSVGDSQLVQFHQGLQRIRLRKNLH
jgi:hypothetical protein